MVLLRRATAAVQASMLLLILLLLGLAAAPARAATALSCNETSATQDAIARWTSLPVTGSTFSRDLFRGEIWMVGGVSTTYYTKRLEKTTTRSDVVHSQDGAKWIEALEEAPFRRRYGHSLTAFADQSDGVERLVLLGGFSPEPATDVWTSTDGEKWLAAPAVVPWAGRGYHCTVAFDRKLWVLGGSPMNNDVWSTASVVTDPWQKQANVPWSPRAAHGCAAHTVVTNVTLGDASRQTFLFVLGGWRETSLNDVWRMDVSGAWTLLTEAAPWKKRAWHAVVSFDSRAVGDVELGPRLWLLGGGVVGRGIMKMAPYNDVWFTRNGSDWHAASSDASGVSTAEWSMLSTRDKDVCTGKWGHVAVAFERTVPRAYTCSPACVTRSNTTSLAHQLIPVCNANKAVPDAPVLRTILRGSSVSTVTLYPDACELCPGEPSRYVNATKVPALFVIAGNVGAQKVKDVFRSADGMLCEKDGVICSGVGVCTLGGACMCNPGKRGPFCESDMDYMVLDAASCFPETAQVVVEARDDSNSNSAGSTDTAGAAHTSARPRTVLRAMRDVAVGDRVLTLGADGITPVLSTVYYIPHESDVTASVRFLRVMHEPVVEMEEPSALEHCHVNNRSDDMMASPNVCKTTSVLEVTPEHLVYVTPRDRHVSTAAVVGIVDAAHCSSSSSSSSDSDWDDAQGEDPVRTNAVTSCSKQAVAVDMRLQTAARDLEVGDTIFVLANNSCSRGELPRVVASRVVRIEAVVLRRGALTLYTMSGNVFVDGVLCSNFGAFYPVLPGQRRDLLPFVLFAAHRLAFALVPSEKTAFMLRWVMDTLVLPLLRALRRKSWSLSSLVSQTTR